MTTIITTKGGNAAYPPLKVVSTNTGVTIPYLPPGDKPDTSWLTKALREDGSKPSRGSRITAGKLAKLLPVDIPKPMVYVNYTRRVIFLWNPGEQYKLLEITCLQTGLIVYNGICELVFRAEGTEKLGDTLPGVIELWLRRLYG